MDGRRRGTGGGAAVRPDLATIFGARQRKPRQAVSKSLHAKTTRPDEPSCSPTTVANVPAEECHRLVASAANPVVPQSCRQTEAISKRKMPSYDDRLAKGRKTSSMEDVHDVDDILLARAQWHANPDSPDITQRNQPVISSMTSSAVISVDSGGITSALVDDQGPVCDSKVSQTFENPLPRRLVRSSRAAALMNAAASKKVEESQSQRRLTDFNSVIKPKPSDKADSVVATHDSLLCEKKVSSAKSGEDVWITARRLVSTSLPLPTRLMSLEKIFSALETTMRVYKARHRQSVTFPELIAGVQGITQMTFTKSLLAQIVYLFPNGYSLHNKVVKNRESGRNENFLAVSLVELPGIEGINQFQRNKERADLFSELLKQFLFAFYVSWIKSAHPELLADVEACGISKTKSWHPGFPIDRCPPVPRCTLPAPAMSATSYELARLVGGGSAAREASDVVENQAKALPDCNIHELDVPDSLKDVPISLIQKIRLREAANNAMVKQHGNRKDIQNSLDLHSLPDLLMLVHGIFSSLGRPSMFFSALITQLKFKLKDRFVSEASILNRTNLLLELLPKFCQKVVDGRVEAFRVDATLNLGDLRRQLRSEIQKRTLNTETPI
uniref:CDT1 Geminin-binding domain-containing protein n=1 Tax=Spongospora subterranea TaxID=70186 RepID=A0A0H5R7X6_9EUKA|eukprot:CRZ10233.1 hypothetical protein [Spongospora subterranea]